MIGVLINLSNKTLITQCNKKYKNLLQLKEFENKRYHYDIYIFNVIFQKIFFSLSLFYIANM